MKYPHNFVDVTGKKVNRLEFISFEIRGRQINWTCTCTCGKTIITKAHLVLSGHVQSCGCLKKEGKGSENLIGQKFNLLTVVCLVHKTTKRSRWRCLCDCGNYTEVMGYNLKSGQVKSCGCLGNGNNTTHGMTNTRLYNIYDNMKGRCLRPNHKSYKYYGKVGIKICEEWLNSFENFYKWATENGYADHLTIERDNILLGYTPSNCRWATTLE